MNNLQPTGNRHADVTPVPYDRTWQATLVSNLVREVGGSHSADLGIDLRSVRPEEVFKWFVASVLFCSWANESVAKAAYRSMEGAGLLSTPRLLVINWGHLMEVLEKSVPVEHCWYIATGVQVIAWSLDRAYHGDLNRLHFFAKDPRDLKRRLQGLGTVVRPRAVTLFSREMRELWDKAEPPLTENAITASRNLGLVGDTGDTASVLAELQNAWEERSAGSERFCDLETALDKLGRRYCRKLRCRLCQFNDANCRRRIAA